MTVFPANENTRSLGVEDAGQDKYFFAKIERWGYMHAFSFHHCIGHSLLDNLISFKNFSHFLIAVKRADEDANGASSSPSSSLLLSNRLLLPEGVLLFRAHFDGGDMLPPVL